MPVIGLTVAAIILSFVLPLLVLGAAILLLCAIVVPIVWFGGKWIYDQHHKQKQITKHNVEIAALHNDATRAFISPDEFAVNFYDLLAALIQRDDLRPPSKELLRTFVETAKEIYQAELPATAPLDYPVHTESDYYRQKNELEPIASQARTFDPALIARALAESTRGQAP